MIPTPIPSPIIRAEWHSVTDETIADNPHWSKIKSAADEAARKPGWNPKIVPLGENFYALDYCFAPNSDKLHSYKTAVIEDHPILEKLPPNAPRAVRHIYKKEVRLKYLRATQVWDFLRDMNAAEEAAEQYNRDAFDKT